MARVGTLALLFTLTLPAFAATGTAGEELSAQAIRDHLEVLAGDAFAGRAPGTEGGRRTAEYLERALEAAGARPGYRGRWRQQVPLHASRVLAHSQLELARSGEVRVLKLGTDALLLSWGTASAIPRAVPMVFAGYGITAPEFDHDDYADVDVRGRVVVVLAGEPESDDPEFFAGQAATVYSAVDSKRRMAMAHGAVATVILPSVAPGGIGHGWQKLARELATERYQLASGLPDHLSLVLHPDLERWLFEGALYDLEMIRDLGARGCWQSFYLPVSLRFEGQVVQRDVLSPNVVGVIPGRDPELASRPVVVSAHWDHLGEIPEEPGTPALPEDRIYNGAVDNALGVSGVLELARVIAAMEKAPRRSILFVFTTAEEHGLLGAQAFLEDPPVPVADMVAAVNVDGLAIRGPMDGVMAVGGELSDLGWRLERAVRPLGLGLGQAPEELAISEGFSRSDQWAFAEAGVPAVMVNEGFPSDPPARAEAIRRSLDWLVNRYHTPADDAEQPIDYRAARRHLQAILALVLALADSPTEPAWRPHVPFAYIRAVSRAEAE